MSSFAANHPGGTFSITHNIGRDISKFFYGGYSLEPTSGLAPHTHSYHAKLALESLIIGQVDWEIKQVRAKIIEHRTVNLSTDTFILQTSDPVFCEHFKSIEMLGKHYLVCSLTHPNVKRHYTISNCMKPAVYDEYLRVIDLCL